MADQNSGNIGEDNTTQKPTFENKNKNKNNNNLANQGSSAGVSFEASGGGQISGKRGTNVSQGGQIAKKYGQNANQMGHIAKKEGINVLEDGIIDPGGPQSEDSNTETE
jgi:hypothetical protein